MQPYSLLVTSCDRHDLLEKTIKSFLKNVDVPPRQIVIVEDGSTPMPAFLNKYKHLGLTWINNGTRRGQIYSCDRLWSECKYDFAMWMEDDWQFTQGDFLSKSFEILDKYPEVITVGLRGDWNHPLIDDPRFPFKIAEPNWKGGWGSFAFNPGLRRRKEYTRIGSYGKHVGYGSHGLGHEMDLSKLYASMGYVIAVLPGHCAHIGGGRSRAIEPILDKAVKILIAVPACHKLNYGAWESEESPAFNKATAWQGKAYGKDIHISGENPRIQAVRDTWWNNNHPNITKKFFYGTVPGFKYQPLDDEVVLPVPDDYAHLPKKTMAICKWSLQNGFDYILKVDDDTYVYPDRAAVEVQSQSIDFAGHINGGACSGGCGYYLSRRAMEAVVRNPINSHWAEDVTVGMIMKAAHIAPIELPMHIPGYSDHWYMPNGFDPSKINTGIVCAHAVQPEIMREWYDYEKARKA